MQEYKSATNEYRYEEEDDLNLHAETITLLYIPGHYDVIYTKKDVEEYPLICVYDNIKPACSPAVNGANGKTMGMSPRKHDLFVEELKEELKENQQPIEEREELEKKSEDEQQDATADEEDGPVFKSWRVHKRWNKY